VAFSLYIAEQVRCLYCEYEGSRIVHPANESFHGRSIEFETMLCGDFDTGNYTNNYIIEHSCSRASWVHGLPEMTPSTLSAVLRMMMIKKMGCPKRAIENHKVKVISSHCTAGKQCVNAALVSYLNTEYYLCISEQESIYKMLLLSESQCLRLRAKKKPKFMPSPMLCGLYCPQSL
jgi:hypothetical protein